MSTVQVSRTTSAVEVSAVRNTVEIGTPSIVAHSAISGREAADSHPIGAITGLLPLPTADGSRWAVSHPGGANPPAWSSQAAWKDRANVFAAGSVATPTLALADAGIGLSSAAGGLDFSTAGAGRARLDANGVLVVGDSIDSMAAFAGGVRFLQQQHGTGYAYGIGIARWNADQNGIAICLAKSKMSTVGVFGETANNDNLGFIKFDGVDNSGSATVFRTAAWWAGRQDGASGANFVPGKLCAYTIDQAGAGGYAMTIDSFRRAVFGSASVSANLGNSVSLATFSGGTLRPALQVHGTSVAQDSAICQVRFDPTASDCPQLIGAKSGSSTYDAYTAVAAGASLYTIAAEGADGTDFARAASIRFLCNGTVSANVVPGSIELWTANASGTETLALTLDASQNLTPKDGGNIILGTTTGSKIGTATSQKIGFWNATPVIQPAAAAQAAPAAQGQASLTDSTGGTASTTLAAITAGASYAQADMTAVKNALASLAARLAEVRTDVANIKTFQNAARTALVNTGLIKGAA